MKTFSAKNETVKRDWYVVDATGKTLGRLSTEIARRLRGKHKPEFTPHVDTGDYIVVVNAGEDRRHRQQAARQDVPPVHRLHRQHEDTPASARLLPEHPERAIEIAREGHAAEESAGPRDVPQAQGLCAAPSTSTPRSSPRSSILSQSEVNAPWHISSTTTAPAVARPPRPACSCEAGQRPHHRQRQAAGRILRPRDLAHDRAPAARPDRR